MGLCAADDGRASPCRIRPRQTAVYVAQAYSFTSELSQFQFFATESVASKLGLSNIMRQAGKYTIRVDYEALLGCSSAVLLIRTRRLEQTWLKQWLKRFGEIRMLSSFEFLSSSARFSKSWELDNFQTSILPTSFLTIGPQNFWPMALSDILIFSCMNGRHLCFQFNI